MSARPYSVDDGLPPEHVQQGATLRHLLARMDAMQQEINQMSAATARLRKQVAYLEGAHSV